MKGSMYFEQIPSGKISSHIPEYKAVLVNVGNQKHIVENLSRLYSPGHYKIYMVGSTPARLPKVLARCREAGLPAVVNCGKDLPRLASFMPGEPYSAALISPGSATGTFAQDPAAGPDRNPLEYVLSDPFALHFSHLGFQSYLYDPDLLEKLREKYFEDMRLGLIREDISLCEPLLRNARFIFYDLHALRYSDYPCSPAANPNGLYAEEACSIARYAGLSQKAEAVFIYGGPEGEEALTVCNKLVAEIIWHLCEGIAANITENPDNKLFEESYHRKIVGLGQEGQEIVFINSSVTDRWWMEIPAGNVRKARLVPCSIKDYQTACSGDIPLRWLFFYQKYMNL